MSEIKYGLISETDARTLEKTIDLMDKEFDGVFHILEVGVYGGGTAKGLKQYIESGGHETWITGIDNNKDGQEISFNYDQLIIGNSNEVYNQIEDNSQHLIFEDSCHCFACVCSTFFCYAPKVKVGGYFAFHDCGKHIQPFKDFQHGDKNNPDAYISVRKALKSIGLLDYTYENLEADGTFLEQWELVFDEADETNPAGGICVFRKIA